MGRVREGTSGSFRRTGPIWFSLAPPALHLPLYSYSHFITPQIWPRKKNALDGQEHKP